MLLISPSPNAQIHFTTLRFPYDEVTTLNWLRTSFSGLRASGMNLLDACAFSRFCHIVEFYFQEVVIAGEEVERIIEVVHTTTGYANMPQATSNLAVP